MWEKKVKIIYQTIAFYHKQMSRVKLKLLRGFGLGRLRCLAWAETVCVCVCVFVSAREAG